MRYLINIIRIIPLLTTLCTSAKSPYSLDALPLKPRIKDYIKKGEIYRKTQVDSFDLQQKLDFKIAGLHPNNCQIALKTLSRYEDFKDFLDFVTLSHYSDKNQRIILYLQSKVLPFNMILDFKLERITKEGLYHFSFDKGFLKDLKGEIHVTNYKNRCLFYSTANWKGKKTGIPNFLFEVFTNTLSEKSMNVLFRISKRI